VTLTGYVRDASERAAAAEDLAHLPGVVAITNQIDVR
jgi:osmotically-inducible protein OsmY